MTQTFWGGDKLIVDLHFYNNYYSLFDIYSLFTKLCLSALHPKPANVYSSSHNSLNPRAADTDDVMGSSFQRGSRSVDHGSVDAPHLPSDVGLELGNRLRHWISEYFRLQITPKEIVARIQVRRVCWPLKIRPPRYDAILELSSQPRQRLVGRMRGGAILLVPHGAPVNVLIVQYNWPVEATQHLDIAIGVDRNLRSILLEKVWPYYRSVAHRAPYHYFFDTVWCLVGVRWWLPCPKPHVLLVDVARKVEPGLVCELNAAEKVFSPVHHLQKSFCELHTNPFVIFCLLLLYNDFVRVQMKMRPENSVN